MRILATGTSTLSARVKNPEAVFVSLVFFPEHSSMVILALMGTFYCHLISSHKGYDLILSEAERLCYLCSL